MTLAKRKIVVVGGVAGGASAAARARRVNPEAEIIIFEKGPNISYANCGIPYHLGGEISDREKLLVAKPELFEERFGIQVKTEHLVESIDQAAKTIQVTNLKTGQGITETFDKLILSTGVSLRSLPLATENLENFYHLWTLQDMDSIISYIKQNKARSAAVIGAGFVGLEVVEQLKRLNIKVHLIEFAAQVLGPIDIEMSQFIEEELIKNGTDVYLSQEVKKFTEQDGVISSLTLSSGKELQVDFVVAGIGVTPKSELAKESGLEVADNACVVVNEFQQTSNPDIYAVGDVSQYVFGPTKQKVSIPLAGPANRSGRIAGEHSAADSAQYSQEVFGTSIVRVFDKAAALTGLSEKLCKRLNLEHRVVYISASHHASYFPGATSMILKLIYDPSNSRVLGCQGIGEHGVDKRIDIVASLLHFGGTLEDLATLDLAYAPPFGSAKDPLHQLASVALNDMDKRPRVMHPASDIDDFQVVDVRTAKELETLPLESAIHIPIDDPSGDIRKRVTELDPQRKTVIVCHSGKRAHVVASILCGLGFREVHNLTGGMMMRSRFNTH
jgi:NADPH-dependent 2,4-dienoyl-CoA reductase/sulfur reductase-like enzyme/rhodanese-related sulfurtransferase